MPLLLASESSFLAELWAPFERTFFAFEDQYYKNFSFGNNQMINLRYIIIGAIIMIIAVGIYSIYNKLVLGDFVRALIGEECDSPQKAKTLTDLGFGRDTFIRSSLRRGVTLKKYVRCADEEEYYLEIAKKRLAGRGAGGATCEGGEDPQNSTRVEKNDDPQAESAENQASSTSENSVKVGEILQENEKMTNKVGENSQESEENSDIVGESQEKTAKTSLEEELIKAKLLSPPYKHNFETDRFYICADDKYRAEIKFNKKGSGWIGIVFATLVAIVFLFVALFFMPDILRFLDNAISAINGK